MKDITKHIQKTLYNLYPPEEINCFVRLILSHVCGLSYNQQILCKDNQICENEKDEIFSIVNRLKKMEPLQYILGETEFYSLPMKVNPDVLIPRPETEELVDIIIKKVLQKNSLSQIHDSENFILQKDTSPHHITNRPTLRILDIGTGSGCIAIALAKHIPNAVVTAIDISETALQTAKDNALLNNVNIRFIRADILNLSKTAEPITGDFDIIASNPPYVTIKEKDLMSENVLNYEPHSALFVPDDNPLLFYDAIANFALRKLTSGGMIHLEINPEYDTDTNEMLHNKGFTNTEVIRDLSGKNRFISVKF